jgi:hypothetical protein
MSSALGTARNHKEPCQKSKEPGEAMEYCDWPGNPGRCVINELGRCHNAAASCVRSTAPVSEMYHENDGRLLGSTYCQFCQVARTYDAQHTGNRKKRNSIKFTLL